MNVSTFVYSRHLGKWLLLALFYLSDVLPTFGFQDEHSLFEVISNVYLKS